MRWESDTLIAEQKKMTVEPWVVALLTQGESSHSYYRTSILSIEHTEELYSHKAELVLQNADKALTSLDLKGYEASISNGFVIGEGEEVSETAPLTVIGQQFDSSPGKITCTLQMVGIPNMLAEDRASAVYEPDETDTKTTKALITEILGATLPCFSHCKAYEITWGSGTGAGTLMNDYIPKDGFRIYVNNSRLAALRWLIDNTKCVMVFRAGGKIKIFEPTDVGETFDYEHSLDSGHTFFAKACRRRLVIPTTIVVQSEPDDDPQYSGISKDLQSIDSLDGQEYIQYEQRSLESNSRADEIADAILFKYRMHAEAGAASVPMNVCAEVCDYIKVTDGREGDYRIGNIGSLTRIYKPGQYEMRFSFGGWLTVRKWMSNLEVYPSGFGSAGQYFSRLNVKHLYAEHILAENVDFVWIDPDNTIDLSKIGDTLDNLADGETYARVKTLHLDAGQIKLDEHVYYASGYDPTTKMAGDAVLDDIPNGVTYSKVLTTDIQAGHIILSEVIQSSSYRTVTDAQKSSWTDKPDDMDEIGEGTTYKRVLATDISAGHLKLTSETVIDGEWYNESGVEIDASHGINIYGTANALTTRATKTGTIQCYVGADGKIYAGAGSVILDVDGLTINGAAKPIFFKIGATSYALLGVADDETGVTLVSADGKKLYLYSGDDVEIKAATGKKIYLEAPYGVITKNDIRPNLDNTCYLGFTGATFARGYINRVYAPTRLKIPVGSNMYD